MNLSTIAITYLNICNIEISPAFLNKRIKSHPYFPALIAFTDTLDELGLDYQAVETSENYVEQLGFPFLAGTPKAASNFEIIPSLQYYLENKENFLNRWDGVALKIKPDQQIHSKPHDKYLKKKEKSALSFRLALGFGTLAFVATTFYYFNAPLFLFTFLSITGIATSSILVLHGMGQSSALAEQLCSTKKSQDCNLVLNSKAAKITNEISLGDTGLIYFIALFLFALYSPLMKNPASSLSLLSFPSGLAVCVSLFSVYYQWKIVKAWCRMCLIVVAICLLQGAALAITFLTYHPLIIPSAGAVLLFLLSCILALVWLLVKPLFAQNKELEAKTIDALKWKRNPDVFISLLQKQQKVKGAIKNNALLLGNENAPLQFTIVSNPFCGPCALAHEHLECLLRKYPDWVSISVIFSIKDADDREDRRLLAAEHILNAIEPRSNEREVLHHWFKTMSIEQFLSKYPAEGKGINVAHVKLKNHAAWMAQNHVPHTPLIFLNGYVLPKQYQIDDVKAMIADLWDSIQEATKQFPKTIYEKEVVDLSWQ